MGSSFRWSDILVPVGLLAMLVGALDPLEGSLLVLPGGGLVALGAYLGKHPRRKLLYLAFVLMAVGVGALWGVSSVGGLGGSTGRSMWWGLFLLPYPAGWVMGLVGTIGKGRYRKLIYVAFALMAVGIAVLVGLFAVEGAGGGQSVRLAFSLVPYLVGVLIGLLASVLALIESFKGPTR